MHVAVYAQHIIVTHSDFGDSSGIAKNVARNVGAYEPSLIFRCEWFVNF